MPHRYYPDYSFNFKNRCVHQCLYWTRLFVRSNRLFFNATFTKSICAAFTGSGKRDHYCFADKECIFTRCPVL